MRNATPCSRTTDCWSASAPSVRVQDLVPDCIGMSVAMLEDELVVSGGDGCRDRRPDSMQYLADGLCLEAVREQRLVELNGAEVLDEEEWRIFALASAASAVASTLTIHRHGRPGGRQCQPVRGSGHAFTDVHEQLAELLGAYAPGAVENADLSFSTRRLAEDAPVRLATGPVRNRCRPARGKGAALRGGGEGSPVSAAQRAGVSLSRIAHAVIPYYSR